MGDKAIHALLQYNGVLHSFWRHWRLPFENSAATTQVHFAIPPGRSLRYYTDMAL
ncbi:hypothetical protein L917_04092 [Phytophthora nicotianae]|uniref:Uncharacterized protein n=1 Tax=Phytophthora nicotianae TaxID=4792 RepID=W2JH54_PHYNI|nr:hypothetical protein L916_04208 [Phytophthora nicotianae]ETL98936.1 hypothetical protein L917_04092 [Phytophthora nicotianae]